MSRFSVGAIALVLLLTACSSSPFLRRTLVRPVTTQGQTESGLILGESAALLGDEATKATSIYVPQSMFVGLYHQPTTRLTVFLESELPHALLRLGGFYDFAESQNWFSGFDLATYFLNSNGTQKRLQWAQSLVFGYRWHSPIDIQLIAGNNLAYTRNWTQAYGTDNTSYTTQDSDTFQFGPTFAIAVGGTGNGFVWQTSLFANIDLTGSGEADSPNRQYGISFLFGLNNAK